MKRLILPLLMLLAVLAPTPVYADVGDSIVGRFWDSIISTAENRMESKAPATVRVLQEAERIFLGSTEDITTHSAVRDVYAAMRVAGLLLLGLCTVISLSQLTEAGLMGESSNITEWLKRFMVAAFMTMGSIHFYGLWIRIFNAMLAGFRGYLDTHWQGPSDSSALYTQMIGSLDGANTLLILLFAVVTLVVLIILWFLIGGVRMAELAIAVIIAPLVWPVYLIPTLEDIPKAAFRSFLGLNATLLIIVGMLRLAMRMELGGGLANSVWNIVPAIAMLIMTVFLPTMIKRLVGQGNTGSGGLMTAAYMLAGLKGLSMVSGAGGAAAAAKPPGAAPIPPTPSGPSAYPVAPVGSSGGGGGHTQPPVEETWITAPRQIHAGMHAANASLEAPFQPAPGQRLDIELGQSKPGSNTWDTVEAITAYMDGRRRTVDGPRRPSDAEKE